MNRGTRTLVVVTVAVATATVASACVYRAIRRIPVREVPVAHRKIVFAGRPLALGARIAPSDLKAVAWPSDSPLAGTFTRTDDLFGRGVIAPIAENEPITESKLAPRGVAAGLAPAIPPGLRAISVKVNEVIGVAGFVVPGAHVDVVATVRHQSDAVSRVLISNVQVLTAGTRYEQEKAHDVKPIPSTVITLVVTPEQAERIALASAEGQLTLMLRNPLDVAEPVTAGAHLARLVDDRALAPTAAMPIAKPVRVVPKPIAAPTATGPAPIATAYTVEAIRGGKRTEEILK